MARQIIVLENQAPGRASSDPITYRYALWLSVPVARQSLYANATATSVVKNASAGELTAIQSGSIKEIVGVFQAIGGTSIAAIEASLVQLFNDAQAVLNSAAGNPYDHYGTNWDGATWTLVTVA